MIHTGAEEKTHTAVTEISCDFCFLKTESEMCQTRQRQALQCVTVAVRLRGLRLLQLSFSRLRFTRHTRVPPSSEEGVSLLPSEVTGSQRSLVQFVCLRILTSPVFSVQTRSTVLGLHTHLCMFQQQVGS